MAKQESVLSAVQKEEPKIINLIEWFILKENMTQKKVQKLAYYAQAWSLVLLEQDIVPKIKFQAWVHGPVNLSIRAILKKYGWKDIMVQKDFVTESKKEIETRFSKDAIKVLKLVWNTYGDMTANELESLTHSEKPWREKREGLGTFEASKKIISNKTMKSFYESIAVKDVLQSF